MKTKIRITPLGAGQEVGRSSILLQIDSKNILLDAGLHPGYLGYASLPYYDSIKLESIDLLLISHFHIDHCAALPYLLSKPEFKAQVFMTAPTKSVYKVIVQDYLKVAGSDSFYSNKHLDDTYDRIRTLRYHEVVELSGIRFWCYSAGHVLGAAEFVVTVEGVTVLYTGDFTLCEDRHLPPAEIPSFSPFVTIMESTFGFQCHPPTEKRERMFANAVKSILLRGGKAMIPVFALGRAQELLLMLEEIFANNKALQRFRVYFVSSLASKCLPLYRTYTDMMSAGLQLRSEVANPFKFKFVKTVSDYNYFDGSSGGASREAAKNMGGLLTHSEGTLSNGAAREDRGLQKKFSKLKEPCVILASPGMLQNGFSRELFEYLSPDPRNGIILTGYAITGTLAKTLQESPATFQSLRGQSLPRRIEVFNVNFTAHADASELIRFAEAVDSPYYVLVHGEKNEMSSFKDTLLERFRRNGKNGLVFNPKNCQTIQIEVDKEPVLNVPKKLLEEPSGERGGLEKEIVGYQYGKTVYSEGELEGVGTFKMTQRIDFPKASLREILSKVGPVFRFRRDGEVTSSNRRICNNGAIFVADCVELGENENGCFIEWVCGKKSDSVAETIVELVNSKDVGVYGDNSLTHEDVQKDLAKKENDKVAELLRDAFIYFDKGLGADKEEGVAKVSNDKINWVSVCLSKVSGSSVLESSSGLANDKILVKEIIEIVKGFIRPIG